MSEIFNTVAPPVSFDVHIDLKHPLLAGKDGKPDFYRVGAVLRVLGDALQESPPEKLAGDMSMNDGSLLAYWIIHTREQEDA